MEIITSDEYIAESLERLKKIKEKYIANRDPENQIIKNNNTRQEKIKIAFSELRNNLMSKLQKEFKENSYPINTSVSLPLLIMNEHIIFIKRFLVLNSAMQVLFDEKYQIDLSKVDDENETDKEKRRRFDIEQARQNIITCCEYYVDENNFFDKHINIEDSFKTKVYGFTAVVSEEFLYNNMFTYIDEINSAESPDLDNDILECINLINNSKYEELIEWITENSRDYGTNSDGAKSNQIKA